MTFCGSRDGGTTKVAVHFHGGQVETPEPRMGLMAEEDTDTLGVGVEAGNGLCDVRV